MATPSASNGADGQEQTIGQDHEEQQYILRVGWKALFGFTTRKHLPVLFGALLCASIAATTMPVFAIVYGLIFREYTDYGAGKIDGGELLREVTKYCIILASIASLNWVANSFYFFLFLTFGELQARSARNRVFDALIKKDMAWFDTRETGITAFLPAVQMHIRDLQLSVSAPLGEGVQCIVQGLAALGVAFYYSWNLTLVIICSVPLVYLIQAFIASRLSIRAHEQANKLQQALKYITSAVKNIETVKYFNGERYELQSFTKIVASAAHIYRRVANLRSIQIGVMQFFTLTVFFQGFWYGSHLIKSGNIDVGQVVTTFWAALMAIQGITGFLPQFIVLQTGKMAGAQLRVLLEQISKSDQRQELLGHVKPRQCLGNIEFREVTFSYPTRTDDVAIKDISLFLPAGEITFIIGKSGSGKSTLGQLLVRFYQPSSGQIFLDGVPLDKLDVQWLRHNIMLVEQQSILFNNTIRENIALGTISDTTSFSDVEVHNAIKFAMLEPVIQELPERLDTHVGMQGNSLSGGQKQKMALARARVRDTPVLILDESTSAVDYITKAAMVEGIRKWRKGKPTIVITHDISQIQPFDFVYLLDNAHLVQEGYRKELEANPGPFQAFLTSHNEDQAHEDTENENSSDKGGSNAIIYCDPPTRPHSPMRRPLSAVLFGDNVLQPFLERDRELLREAAIASPRYPRSSFDYGEEVHGSQRSSMLFASSAFKVPPSMPSSAPGAFQLLESGSRRGSRTSQTIHMPDPHLHALSRPLWTSPSLRSGSRVSSRPASRQVHNPQNHSVVDGPSETSNEARRLQRGSKFLPYVKLANLRNGGDEKVLLTESLPIMEIMKTVWPVLDWRTRLVLFVAILCAGVHSAATPIFAWVFAQLLATYYEPGDQTRRALVYALSILGIAVVDGVAYYLMFFLSDSVAQSWALALKTEAMRRILLQPREFFDREENSISRLAETLDHFAEEARNLPGRFACIVFVIIFMIAISIIWSLITSWKLALVALATGPILYVITQCYNMISGRWERLSNAADDKVGELMHEVFVNIRTVRCLVLESYFRNKFREKTTASVNVGIKRALYSGAIFGLNFAGILFIATLLFWYGATLISTNQYTVTQITEAFLILLLSVNHVALMTNYMTQVNISRDAGARLLRLARLPTTSHELNGTMQLYEAGDIRLDSVSFAYPTRKDFPVLNDISFRIPKGSCTAIVGSSGSGKSTIAALLFKLYRTEPSIFNISHSPDLTISNYDIKTLHTTTLRSRMAIVSQTPVLFPGTIAQNITYGLSPSSHLATIENTRRAAEAAGVADFIDSLPHGYQTLVGDGGTTLSGGQAQRLAIARALVRDPDILILDEATSALDVVSAGVIRDTILSLVREARPPLSPIESSPVMPADGLWGEQTYFGVGIEAGMASAKTRGKMRRKVMTVIIITHAREMMAIAEHVIMLDKGRVVEEGSFRELKKKRGGALKRLLRGESYDV